MRSIRHITAAAVLVVAWIGLPVLSALHVSLEEHNYCSEHGTLEEGAGAEHSPTAASSTHDAADRPVDSEDHEVCEFGDCFVRDPMPLPAEAVVSNSTTMVPAPLAMVGIVRESSIALLRLSPKNSPPANA